LSAAKALAMQSVDGRQVVWQRTALPHGAVGIVKSAGMRPGTIFTVDGEVFRFRAVIHGEALYQKRVLVAKVGEAAGTNCKPFPTCAQTEQIALASAVTATDRVWDENGLVKQIGDALKRRVPRPVVDDTMESVAGTIHPGANVILDNIGANDTPNSADPPKGLMRRLFSAIYRFFTRKGPQ